MWIGPNFYEHTHKKKEHEKRMTNMQVLVFYWYVIHIFGICLTLLSNIWKQFFYKYPSSVLTYNKNANWYVPVGGEELPCERGGDAR